jgi:translation initiation factor IF-2
MIEFKYKIKEMADDLSMPAKEVIELIGKFYDKPKSSSQNLTEEQLNVLFDYLTQQHQIASLEEVFAAAKPAQPEPAPAPAAQPAPQPAPAPQRTAAAGPAAASGAAAAAAASGAAAAAAAPRAAAVPAETCPAAAAAAASRAAAGPAGPADPAGPEAPAAGAPPRAPRHRHERRHREPRPLRRPRGFARLRPRAELLRRQAEDRLRKLQLEIAKNTQQLKVSIPDEISVGELASRMKKTGAEVIKQLMKNGIMASCFRDH